MSPIILMAGGLLLGGIAGFFAGRLVAGQRRSGEHGDDEVRLRRQMRELSAELRQVREELAHEAATANQIPFIVKKLGEPMEKDAIPGLAVRVVKDLFRTPTAGFLKLKEDGGAFVLEEGIGFPPEWKGSRTFSASAGILGAAVKQHMELAKEDFLGGLATWPRPPSSLEEVGVFPDLVAPVIWRGRIYGMLVAAGSHAPLARKRPYMSMLADMVATAVQNSIAISQKDRQASTDQLTGLFNRTYFNPLFERELGIARETMVPLSVLLFDIDHFKNVNDTYGHPAGDVILKRLAELVVKGSRTTDVVVRYGGEEFVVLMGATNKEQAFAYAERLREKIAQTPFPVPGHDAPLRVAVSVGVSGFPEDGDSPADLVKAADAALYEAKNGGRNRVVRAVRVGLDGKPF
ncbi:MAG: GGDEF domain-containing protein [Gemmatimonadota bacterium]